MKTEENALLVVDEELGELAEACLRMQHRIKKVLRFSGNEVQPGQLKTNAQRVSDEFNDLFGAVGNLVNKGFPIEFDSEAQLEKMKKIARYEQHSRDNGTITD